MSGILTPAASPRALSWQHRIHHSIPNSPPPSTKRNRSHDFSPLSCIMCQPARGNEAGPPRIGGAIRALLPPRWRRCGGSSMYGSTLSQLAVLRRSALFAPLGDDEIDAILAHATITRYAEGDQIFAKGDPGNSMMAVLKGRIMISAPSTDGRQVVLTVFRDGEVFGEIALLDGKERTADATAMGDCELLVVPRRELLSLLGR